MLSVGSTVAEDTASSKANVYLDIDGVLLGNDLNPALHVHDFLKYVTNNFTPYWLTTHCKGDASTAVKRLGLVFPDETMILIQNILPTNWDLAKTEAIDFTKPFLWFDDDLFFKEAEDLVKHAAMDNWIEVGLRRNPSHLSVFLSSFPIPVTPKLLKKV
jgi:hypothetical protein